MSLTFACLACTKPGGGPAGTDGGAGGGSDGGAADADGGTEGSGVGVDVQTDDGPVRGTEEDGVLAFRGIPYAAPPIGARRFAPPARPEPWTDPLLADQFAPVCPQPDGEQIVGDEDCLYLNVWTHPDAAERPVMFFIHGGAGTRGGTDTYDGAALARRTGAVVVTVAYRLGPLGWMALPEIGDGSGNFATLDQQAGLDWVQRNIERFGGDPSQVFLFGESAGAAAVCAQIASPATEGMFRFAVAESAPACATLPTLEEASAGWQAVAGDVGCDADLECLRQADAADLIRAAATRDVEHGATMDGEVIPAQPSEVWLQGDRADVGLVVGTNRDESNFFLALLGDGVQSLLDSKWGYQTAVRTLWPDRGDALLALYPYEDYPGGLEAISELGTDVIFACPAREWARAWTLGGGTAWHYEFTAALHGELAHYGAAHGVELLFLWNNFDSLIDLLDQDAGPYTPDEDELALVDWMQDTWSGMAATADVNPPGTGWPPVEIAAPQHLEISYTRGPRSTFRGGRCEDLVDLGVVERP